MRRDPWNMSSPFNGLLHHANLGPHLRPHRRSTLRPHPLCRAFRDCPDRPPRGAYLVLFQAEVRMKLARPAFAARKAAAAEEGTVDLMKMISKYFQQMKSVASCSIPRSWLGLALIVLFAAFPIGLQAAGEQRYASPDAAVSALKSAADAKDTNAVRAIFGPEGHELISPDIVQANENFNLFVKRIGEKTRLVPVSDSKELLEIGNEGWPFPIPLVKQDGQWYFDVAQGREEILNRRIGMDEIGAINVCHAYVNAQREYAAKDRDNDEVLDYARHLRSTPGKHDGLYWPMKNASDELSPLGPLITEAREEGYHRSTGMMTEEGQTPYHGYYYKILTRQGKHAPGGKYNYIINDHMIGGFALVAWPAEWGNTGVMTFLVNQRGKVYQKNLGPKTDSIASHINSYDPDDTWTSVSGNSSQAVSRQSRTRREATAGN
jgi:hypothetical protein